MNKEKALLNAVTEIVSETKTQAHRLTPFAHVEGTTLTYPAAVPDPST